MKENWNDKLAASNARLVRQEIRELIDRPVLLEDGKEIPLNIPQAVFPEKKTNREGGSHV